MKIALVSPYDFAYPSGVNVHISHLADNFARKGHEVKIIAPSSKDGIAGDKLTIIGRPIPFHASGSVVRVVASPRLFFFGRIKKLLEAERFDLIHIHEPVMPTVSVAVLHHSDREVKIGTFHASRERSWGYASWRPLVKRWLSKLDGKTAVSRSAMELINRYVPGDYTIIPNGVDFPHFSTPCAPIEEFCDGKLNILFVGRLEKRKGFDWLLRAFRLVQTELPNSRLIVVGPGGGLRQRRYQRMVSQYNLRDVVFVGYVPYDELPRYYQTADVFCSPATEKESFGIVLLEAMAATTPIVASDMGGYHDLVSHGAEGLLVPPRDEQALANSLIRLLQDKPLRQEMGLKGRLKARDFDWEIVAAKVLDYYQSVLSHPRAGR